MHRMERCSLDMCFAVNTDVVKQQIQALGMQRSEVAGCDSTCSNLQSIFCRSLSVYFYCYFTSHDKEVEDPLLAKKPLQMTMTKGRVSLPDPTVPYPPGRFFSLHRYWVCILCGLISFDCGRDVLYLTPKIRYSEEFVKCFNVL